MSVFVVDAWGAIPDHQAQRREDQAAENGERFFKESENNVEETNSSAGMSRGPKKSGCGCMVLILGLVVVAAVVLVVFFWKKSVGMTVAKRTWTKEVMIEEFGLKNENDWCQNMPHDAFNVYRSREVRSHNQVPDGEECSTRRVDRGDGTYINKEECRTRYRREPVYDYKCRYQVERWIYAHSFTSQGNVQDEPKWPEVKLKSQSRAEVLGNEREGRRVEQYLIHLTDPQGKTYICAAPKDQWDAIKDGSKLSVKVRVVTSGLDCATLVPGGAEPFLKHFN